MFFSKLMLRVVVRSGSRTIRTVLPAPAASTPISSFGSSTVRSVAVTAVTTQSVLTSVSVNPAARTVCPTTNPSSIQLPEARVKSPSPVAPTAVATLSTGVPIPAGVVLRTASLA